MVSVAATDFVRNFAHYKNEAQREPVAITSHGRTEAYMISAAEFEFLQQVLASSRRAYHPRELPEHLQAAIAVAKMDERHDHLDALMDD